MTALIFLFTDLIAVTILVCALYLRRHHRRDLAVALLGVNVGVVAVAAALANSTVGAGLGMGLFGVLSIIRLRSTELAQHEVAYYFAALALGLLGGLAPTPMWFGLSLMGLIVGVLALVDHKAVFVPRPTRLVQLDRAYDRDSDIIADLERRMGITVLDIDVQRVDHVTDTTLVQVRWCQSDTANAH
ncbi:MAG: DUF4956 domain-containing protein [Propionibacteriaceae bacterium]